MSRIRPAERTDMPAITELYQRRVRAEEKPPPELAGYLERLTFDCPWADEDMPSLVSEDRDGAIVGFIVSNPRRFRLDSRPVRIGCSGPMVSDDAHPGIGALLSRAYMRGPQEISLTDGASNDMHRIWTAMRGRVNTTASFGWEKVLRPGARAVEALGGRRRPLPAPLARLATAADGPVRRLPKVGNRLRGPAVDDLTSELLTPEVLLEQMSAASRHWRLHPDYDEPYLRWLFAELDYVAPARGRVVRNLVRGPHGKVLGWYVYFRATERVSQVMQIAAPGGDPGPVIDHLIADADAGGAIAVAGRMEPSLAFALRERRTHVSPTTWSLVDANDTSVLGLLDSSQSLLTRLEGEWWMGHHVLWQEERR